MTLRVVDLSEDTLYPVVAVPLQGSLVLYAELRREKGLKKPLLKLTIKEQGSEDVLDSAEVPYDRVDKLMQPRYASFRHLLKKGLGDITLVEFQGFLKTRVVRELVEKYEKYREEKKREREERLRKLEEEYREELEEIRKSPIKHILEVVDFYHVGDEAAKYQLIGVISSRFLPKDYRLHAVLQGPSSVGKNNLVNAFRKITPKKWWFSVTRLTPRALDYMPRSLGRTILYIQEYEGMREAAYSARITISEGELTVSYVTRDPKTGEMKTVNRKILGTPVVITTTTRISIDEDMETRTLFINLDESPEQTKKVIEHIKRLETSIEEKEKKRELAKKAKVLKLFFRTLKKYDVIIPEELLDGIEIPLTVRARRDFKKIVNFIKAYAVLHQHTREKISVNGVEYIVASREDLELVEKYVLPSIRIQTQNLTEKHIKALAVVESLKTVTARELAEEMSISYRYAKKLLDDLAEKGLLIVDTKSKPYKYSLSLNTHSITSYTGENNE